MSKEEKNNTNSNTDQLYENIRKAIRRVTIDTYKEALIEKAGDEAQKEKYTKMSRKETTQFLLDNEEIRREIAQDSKVEDKVSKTIEVGNKLFDDQYKTISNETQTDVRELYGKIKKGVEEEKQNDPKQSVISARSEISLDEIMKEMEGMPNGREPVGKREGVRMENSIDLDQLARQRESTLAIEKEVDAMYKEIEKELLAEKTLKAKQPKQSEISIEDIIKDTQNIKSSVNPRDAINNSIDLEQRASVSGLKPENTNETTQDQKLKPENEQNKAEKITGADIFTSRGNDTVNTDPESMDKLLSQLRTMVISKQLDILRQAIIDKEKDEATKNEIKNMSSSTFRDYLAVNQDKVKEVSDIPKVAQELSIAESAGYKAFHEANKDKLSNVGWQENSETKTRVSEIKNAAGDVVCSLNEKTIKDPQTIIMSNGEKREVASYREVDFPKELENGKGPLHLSMAVKGENGKNISEDKAVYFTANYDKNGKLSEISTPMPVKFAGKGKDAIGYIEKDGKVYTLPVTRGKYEEMTKEIAKNHGKDLEKEAGDKALTSPTNEKEAPDKALSDSRKTASEVLAQKLGMKGEKELEQIDVPNQKKGNEKSTEDKKNEIDSSKLDKLEKNTQPIIETDIESKVAIKPVEKNGKSSESKPQLMIEDDPEKLKEKKEKESHIGDVTSKIEALKDTTSDVHKAHLTEEIKSVVSENNVKVASSKEEEKPNIQESAAKVEETIKVIDKSKKEEEIVAGFGPDEKYKKLDILNSVQENTELLRDGKEPHKANDKIHQKEGAQRETNAEPAWVRQANEIHERNAEKGGIKFPERENASSSDKIHDFKEIDKELQKIKMDLKPGVKEKETLIIANPANNNPKKENNIAPDSTPASKKEPKSQYTGKQ